MYYSIEMGCPYPINSVFSLYILIKVWQNLENIRASRFFSYVHGSVHCESVSITVQQDATMYSLLYFCKLLYMFWVVTPAIIRSTFNSNYSIWLWSNFEKCSVWSQL